MEIIEAPDFVPPVTGALSDNEMRELFDSVIELRDTFRGIASAMSQAQTNPMFKMLMGNMGLR